MPRNPYQRRSVKRRHALVACVEVEVAVDGDRVVQGGQQRPAVVHHAEQARCRGTGCRGRGRSRRGGPASSRAGAQAERPRLGEAGRAHDGELAAGRSAVLNSHGHGTRNGFRAGRGRGSGPARSCHGVVELGVGLARRTPSTWWPSVGQLAGEVAGVDALAAGVGVAPVDQPGDAETLGRDGISREVSQTSPIRSKVQVSGPGIRGPPPRRRPSPRSLASGG